MVKRAILNDLKNELKDIDGEVFGKKKSIFWLKLLHPSRYYRMLIRGKLLKSKQQQYNKAYYWTHREQENARCKEYYASNGK